MRPPSTHATCAAAILWPLELPQAHFVLMASNSSDGPEVPEAPGVPGSSDGPGVLDEKEKVGPTYTCSTCREKFYKSAIFILGDDPSMDWQGDLPLIRNKCYNEGCKTSLHCSTCCR